MDDVAADVHGEVTTDGAGLSFQGLGGTDQLAGAGDHAVAFPNHGHDGTGGDEVHQASEEGALAVDAVVALGQFTAGGELLEAHELEALALEAAEDLAHQTALNTIGLDGNKGALGSHNKKRQIRPIVRGRPTAWQAHVAPRARVLRFPALPRCRLDGLR